jgi:hypothetical protein
MRITNIKNFKKILEALEQNTEARDTFIGVLTPVVVDQIETTFNVFYSIVNNVYSLELRDKKGIIIDRIAYNASGDMDDDREWWTTKSTTLENPLAFPTYNKLAEWFNSQNELKLPLLQL